VKRRDLLLGIGAGLALAACQRREEQGKAAPAVVILQADTSGRLPTNLPAYLQVYPGGRVTASTDAGPRGGTVRFVAEATPAQVAEFYAGKAREAGLHATTDVTAAETRILMFDDAPAGHRNFVLNLTGTPQGTQVGLSYGPQA
jgi:hypothetical protein